MYIIVLAVDVWSKYLKNALFSTHTTKHKLTSKHLRMITSLPNTSATTISKLTDVMVVSSLSAALMWCTTSHICYPRDMQHLRSHQRLVTFINLMISMILVQPCASFLVLKKCLSQLANLDVLRMLHYRS